MEIPSVIILCIEHWSRPVETRQDGRHLIGPPKMNKSVAARTELSCLSFLLQLQALVSFLWINNLAFAVRSANTPLRCPQLIATTTER